jgi:2-methylisocitrate lyase-like PEP mutase family enzyme
MPVDDAFDAIARICSRVDVPVSADIEAGYRLPPNEIVQRLLDAGAVGYNIEDTDHHGGGSLLDAHAQAQHLAALKTEAGKFGVDLVLNARVDVFRHSDVNGRTVGEAVRRGLLYVEAGADVIFPIRLGDRVAIGELVAAIPAPINILLRPDTPPLPELIKIGVRRISLGGGIFRAAYVAAHQALTDLAEQLDSPT